MLVRTGETWTPPLYNLDLPSPVENGDMILGAKTPASLGIGKPLLLTHPQSELDRANGTLMMSTTAGLSWEVLLRYSHGCHASSQLVQYMDGTIGVLFDDGGPFPADYNAMKGDCKMKIQQIVGMNETMVRIKLASKPVIREQADARNWSAVVSVGTGECFDTILQKDQVDLYGCVSDGHNERFHLDEARGVIEIGPGDEGPAGASRTGYCLRGLTGRQADAAGLYTSLQLPCNDSDPQQRFEYSGKVLRSGADGLCLTAGPKKNDTTLLLAPCATDSPAQQFEFRPMRTDRPFPPPVPPPPPPPHEPFLLDPAAAGGRRFDGHGGLSAGASSRLLFDYEESVRSDILDYLYKPEFGAALTMCKVEIGGDGQSTNGAEASHRHARNDLNFGRGCKIATRSRFATRSASS